VIGWRSGLVLAALALAACYRARFRSDAPSLGCDGLPNEAWQKLCRRFEPEQELIHAGHAQLVGKRSWSCTSDSVYRVDCSGPVDRAALGALSAWVTDHAGASTRSDLDHCLFLLRRRLERLAEPPPPRDSTMRNYYPKRCPK
jgi:hypothetical protein